MLEYTTREALLYVHITLQKGELLTVVINLAINHDCKNIYAECCFS